MAKSQQGFINPSNHPSILPHLWLYNYTSLLVIPDKLELCVGLYCMCTPTRTVVYMDKYKTPWSQQMHLQSDQINK